MQYTIKQVVHKGHNRTAPANTTAVTGKSVGQYDSMTHKLRNPQTLIHSAIYDLPTAK